MELVLGVLVGLLKIILIYLQVRVINREIFHLLVHSPNAHKSQFSAKLKPETPF